MTQFRVEDVRGNYGAILHLALEIVKSEEPPDEKLLKKLNWIKEHTTENLNTNYFVVVHTIARNMPRPLTWQIEMKVSARRTQDFELGQLISEIEDAHIKINDIVRTVAKKYSIDIPFGVGQGQVTLPEMPTELK